MEERWDLINALIRRYSYRKYLEIGVQKGRNFEKIECPYKIGIDPEKRSDLTTYEVTSDRFFEFNDEMFDIIFIDGLHHREQVRKDIKNSLDVLDPNGTIVCHDMNPKTYEEQKVPREQKSWTGDCWKAFMDLKGEDLNIRSFVVDLDTGIGVIFKDEDPGEPFKVDEKHLTFSELEKNRGRWLNLKSVDEFVGQYVR